jgi:uncharacterized protein (TIGR02117 family)
MKSILQAAHYSKKILHLFFLLVEFFFLFLTVYLLCSLLCILLPVRVDEKGEKTIRVYMKSDGIHTDFVFPTLTKEVDWTKLFSAKNTRGQSSEYPFIAVGWGDQGFFLHTPKWADLKAATAFTALFYLGRTAIHCNYLQKIDPKNKIVAFKISRNQYRQLHRYVKASLKKSKQGGYRCIQNRGYWDTDSFYEAKGSYGLFCTCNSWVNSGLKNAKLPASFWAPFNAGIFYHYQ